MSATIARHELETASPSEIRRAIRSGTWRGITAGFASGFAQANLVVLPRADAFDFLLFCVRNPQACPLIDVTDPGSPAPALAAPDADLRTDLPRYRVYEHGELVEEPVSIAHRWRDDMVAFLLGCSFTFERALIDAGIRMRHVEQQCNVSMYRTTRMCRPAGKFFGSLVVSMRPVRADLVDRAVAITSTFRGAHGEPVWTGDPAALGIMDLAKPDFGDAILPEPDEIPVFWACGVTPQAVAIQSKPELMITHAPGHMFITDIPVAGDRE